MVSNIDLNMEKKFRNLTRRQLTVQNDFRDMGKNDLGTSKRTTMQKNKPLRNKFIGRFYLNMQKGNKK